MKKEILEKRNVVIIIPLILLLAAFFMLCVLYVGRLGKVFDHEAEKYLQSNNDSVSWYLKNIFIQNLNNLCRISYDCGNVDDFFSHDFIRGLHQKARFYGWDRLGIALPDGSYITSSGADGNIAHRDYFKKSMNGEHAVGYVNTSVISHGPIIAFSVPIYDFNRHLRAVLVAICEQDSVIRFFDNGPQLEASISYVVDSEGTLIWTKLDNTDIDFSAFSTVYQTLSYLNMPIEKATAVVTDILQSKKSGIRKVDAGRPYYFLYKPIDNTNWFLFSLLPVADVKKDINSFLHFTLLFVAGVILILIFFCSIIVRMLNHHRKMLYKIAYTDQLLHVPNVNWFRKKIQSVLLSCSVPSYAYIVADVEKFKLLNERFGYENGNKMLRHVYDSIAAELQPGEFVSRIAFDDFCILLKFESGHKIKQRLVKIASAANTFPKTLDPTYFVMLLFGVYIIESDDGRDVNNCYDRAEIALNTALQKQATGMARIGFYHEQTHVQMKNNKFMENRMESALIEGEFVVYLQPKVNIITDTIIGAEALIRWNDPKKGLIPPDQFIPLFEQNGMIAKLDVYVFEEVCRMLRRWIDCGKTPVPISVNLSRAYIANETFLDCYETLRKKYDIPVQYLEFELTESLAFDNLQLLRRLMTDIKSYGYATSLDDFGSGYSSLNVLKDLPVDTIKLDKVFFSSVDDRDSVSTIDVVECIVNLADKLDMKIVAEGIESEKQISFLRYIGCCIVQGYVYSKPVPISEFEKMLFE